MAISTAAPAERKDAMTEYAVICYSGASALQILPGVPRTWDVYCYRFCDDGRMRVRKVATSESRAELVFMCIANFGKAFRYGRNWTSPDWSVNRVVTDDQVKAFVAMLEEVTA